ncbi:SHOCT domain-containing protein [Dethiosulfatarculus sandiegensis]|uniref:SHOCT domain-containing protein n=1 Tax=Dethiosulfatarculus sandiegensis TaxID=1429043 RepID=A0A0D2GLS2_9BACT|nr:SHOCT domain-containing protein [Dethiosulfatarculus sandiegensis]KIX15637.1 hypothetical protein X474_03045 [Dethiosulfatarculus sandiegensis]
MKRNMSASLLGLVLTFLPTFAGAQSWGYGSGWNHPMMWGGGWLGGPLMILIWLIVIVAVIAGIRWAFRGGQGVNPQGGAGAKTGAESSLDILKRRYAAGEIDRKQYIEMKNDIES